MLFLTHVLFGALVGVVFSSWFGGLGFFLMVLLGSILPDIDSSGSKMNRWSGIIGEIVSFFSKHRGFFHSLWFVALSVILVKIFVGVTYAWGLFLGMVSHLVMDGMTRQGVHLVYPLSRFRINGFMKTGGMGEIVVQATVIALMVWKVVG